MPKYSVIASHKVYVEEMNRHKVISGLFAMITDVCILEPSCEKPYYLLYDII